MKILILAISVLTAIVGFAFFLGAPSPTIPPETMSANITNVPSEKQWIEIVKGKVFELDKNGKLIRELKTGDTLKEKRIVDASNSASANIHFPDGSILIISSEKVEVPQTVQTPPKTTQENPTADLKEIRIKTTNNVLLKKISEGENIKFEAVLIFNDNSEKNVTNETMWQVLGGIGTIEKDGTFLSKLDPSVTEFGSAFGNIVGIWKNKTSDKEILGKTPIFKVEARTMEEKINIYSIDPTH